MTTAYRNSRSCCSQCKKAISERTTYCPYCQATIIIPLELFSHEEIFHPPWKWHRKRQWQKIKGKRIYLKMKGERCGCCGEYLDADLFCETCRLSYKVGGVGIRVLGPP